MEKEIKEMLELILYKLDGLGSGMEKLESGMEKLESGMERLETRMDGLETRMDGLESRQGEIYLVAKAIEHSNEVRGAEIDNFKYKVHYVEGTLNTIGDVITARKAIK